MSSNELSGSLRLLFETLKADHATELFEPLGDPLVYEHISETPAITVAAVAARFAFMASGPPPDLANECWLNYVVRLRANGTAVGRLQATIIERRAQVAYLFGPQFWGQG